MSARDTQELVEWIADWRAGQFDSGSRDKDGWPIEMHGLVLSLEGLLERLEAAERATPGQAALTEFELRVKAEAQVRELERDLASSQDAALLLHKRVEELEEQLRLRRKWSSEAEAQLAERDKRIEGLREALERLANPQSFPASEDGTLVLLEVEQIARAALADPVVVPGWDDGTWKQEGCG